MAERGRLGGQVQAVVVISPEGGVALGTLALPGLVARLQAVPAEHVEALGQHGVLALHLARRTREGLLVLADLLQQHFVHAAACHLHLLHALRLPSQHRQLLLHTLLLYTLLNHTIGQQPKY